MKVSIEMPALPMAVVVAGTVVRGRPNFMPAGWVTMANMSPPQLSIAVAKGRYTAEGILEAGAFSINLVTAEMVEKADYCGLFSGRDTDKSDVFETFKGELEMAPLITDSPMAAECLVARTLELPTHYLFVGEVKNAYADEKYVENGKADLLEMRPLVLTMPDNHYRMLGETVAQAWDVGRRLKIAEKR
jgi:flavin reductase (DIM6/NTAB) family NADH-FMN oxidoreductase RutF